MIIEYNGQVLDTKHYHAISDEKCKLLRHEYYQKPPLDSVVSNLKSIHRGGTKVSEIVNYYLKDVMAKTKLYHSKWSIEDVFNCNDLIRHFYAKTLTNDKVYPNKDSDIKKIETALRLGGKGVAAKPSNFPIKTIDYILENYVPIGGNYYDFSCGWGVRLLSSLRNNARYYGTDPNYILTERLMQIGNHYNTVNGVDRFFEIRTHGSEIFVPEWENLMHAAFSSPPYFGLEDYKVGQQSFTDGLTYEEWKSGYLTDTIKNIQKYVVNNGYVLININDYSAYPLFNDTKQIAIDLGLSYIETINLENIRRVKSTGGFNDNSEGIMVFKNVKE